MTRLLLFLVVIVNCQNGYWGNPASSQHFVSVDSMYPGGESGFAESPQPMVRNADARNPAEQSSMCYFVQESELESQISCKLRFTRSKFNFNPFGLRFGKRGDASVNWKSLVVNGKRLPYLWKYKQTTTACKNAQTYC